MVKMFHTHGIEAILDLELTNTATNAVLRILAIYFHHLSEDNERAVKTTLNQIVVFSMPMQNNDIESTENIEAIRILVLALSRFQLKLELKYVNLN